MVAASCVAASAPRSMANEALVANKEAPVVTNVLLLMSGINPPSVASWSSPGHVGLDNRNSMKKSNGLSEKTRRSRVSNPKDCCRDRAMDRGIGNTWWFGHSNKRYRRIGMKGNRQ